MPTVANITEFYRGETVVLELSAKGSDGATLPSAGVVDAFLRIHTLPSGIETLAFSTIEGSVVLTDVGGAVYTATLTPTDLASLDPDTTYYYNFWTGTGDAALLQARGALQIGGSINAN